MGNMKRVLAAVTLAAAALTLGSIARAGEESGKDLLSEDKAIQMALDAYPGMVVKAYNSILKFFQLGILKYSNFSKLEFCLVSVTLGHKSLSA